MRLGKPWAGSLRKPRFCALSANFGRPCASPRGLEEPGQPARWELLRVRRPRGPRHRRHYVSGDLAVAAGLHVSAVGVRRLQRRRSRFFYPRLPRARGGVRRCAAWPPRGRSSRCGSNTCQDLSLLEEGLPEFAEPVATPAAKASGHARWAEVEIPRQAFPARRPTGSNRRGERPDREAAGCNRVENPSPSGKDWEFAASLKPTRSFSPGDGRKAGKIASGPGRGAGVHARNTTG